MDRISQSRSRSIHRNLGDGLGPERTVRIVSFNEFNPDYVKDVNIGLEKRYYITEAMEFVKKDKLPPNTIIHLVTNDLKHMSVNECVKEMKNLVETIHTLHQTKVTVSLPPPSQRDYLNKKIVEFNKILKEDPSIHHIDHTRSFMRWGEIDRTLYMNPNHPNQRGFSRIMSNIKNDIMST